VSRPKRAEIVSPALREERVRWAVYRDEVVPRLPDAWREIFPSDLRRVADGDWRGKCPVHDGENRQSLSVCPSDLEWHCFSCGAGGGPIQWLQQTHGMSEEQARDRLAGTVGIRLDTPRVVQAPPQPDTPEEAYRIWARRKGIDPDWLTRRWGVSTLTHAGRPAIIHPTPLGIDRGRYLDGRKPKVFWALKGGGPHWYGLDHALERLQPGEPLYLTNGESSVWALDYLGVPAICTAAGEGAVPAAATLRQLRDVLEPSGCWVAVVYDLDAAGAAGSRKIASALTAAGLTARALALPESLGEHGDAGDLVVREGRRRIADTLAALPTMEEEIAQADLLAQRSEPDAVGASGPQADDRTIIINDRHPAEIIADFRRIMRASNTVPDVFRRGNELVHLVAVSGEEKPAVIAADTQWVWGRIARHCECYTQRVKKTGIDLAPSFPPWQIAADLCSHVDPALPEFECVVSSPVFDRDGRLVSRPGYDKESGLWVHYAGGLDPLEVAEVPSDEQVEQARALIVDELLADFPFEEPADRAGAVALLLLPFVRRMIAGPTPLHLVDAPVPGAGKSLLSDCCLWPALGGPPEPAHLGKDDDSAEKRLLALLYSGAQTVFFDNIPQGAVVNLPSLAFVLATTRMTGRLLGQTKMVSPPNNAVWVATGNNVGSSHEIERRFLRICIDPRMECPERRTGFRHRLPQWAEQEREQLVWAACTLVQHWIAGGKKAGSLVKGTYQSWASTMSGILEAAGINGLGEREANAGAVSGEGLSWRALFAEWAAEFGDAAVSVTQICDMDAELEEPTLPPIVGAQASTTLGRTRLKLSEKLKEIEGRVYDGRCVEIVKSGRTGRPAYRLARRDGAATPEATPAQPSFI